MASGSGRRLAALAAAGLLAMGADAASGAAKTAAQPTAPEVQAAIEKALPTPRLYRMTTSGSLTVSASTLEMCLSAASVEKLFAAAGPAVKDAPAQRVGCSRSSVVKAGGAFHIETSCDRSAGAARTTHMVIDGTVKDIRQTIEVVLDDPKSGDPRVVSADAHIVEVGACPASLAPGQARTLDGKILEPPAGFGAVPERARR
jgi:hypothetical protein